MAQNDMRSLRGEMVSKGKIQAEKALAAKKEKLFNKYIMPHLAVIKNLVGKYTDHAQDVDDNYNICLTQLYNYIMSYKTDCKLETWIYICVKRACFYQNKKKANEASYRTDLEFDDDDDYYQVDTSLLFDAPIGSLTDNISDQMYEILSELPPQRLSPFLMYAQGCGIREITAAEWELGHLEKKSERIVRSRIFWAQKELQYKLRKHGIAGSSRKGSLSDR